jgi:hypothetical protein
MPRGEDVEIAKLADFPPFLVALFLAAPRALTFLLFFTRLPSSFDPESYEIAHESYHDVHGRSAFLRWAPQG